MSDDALEQLASPRRAWRWPYGWLGLVVLAWAAYELTHSPAIASVLICLKFGWEDFRAARWIWFTDPQPGRRRSLFWLYTAWGLWKIAVVAFFMSIAFASVAPRNPLPPALPQALAAFLGTFLTTLVGFALSTFMTALAVCCAWHSGVRLWLDSGVHRARRFDYWPPTPFCEGRTNRLGLLLLTALALLALFLLVTLLSAAPRGAGGALIGFILTIVAPVVIVLCRELITSKVWAESPYECWPEEWDEPVA